MPDKSCPKCGLWNSEAALRCDCGYDFPSSSVLLPYSKDIPRARLIAKHAAEAVLLFLLLSLVAAALAVAASFVVGISDTMDSEAKSEALRLSLALGRGGITFFTACLATALLSIPRINWAKYPVACLSSIGTAWIALAPVFISSLALLALPLLACALLADFFIYQWLFPRPPVHNDSPAA